MPIELVLFFFFLFVQSTNEIDFSVETHFRSIGPHFDYVCGLFRPKFCRFALFAHFPYKNATTIKINHKINKSFSLITIRFSCHPLPSLKHTLHQSNVQEPLLRHRTLHPLFIAPPFPFQYRIPPLSLPFHACIEQLMLHCCLCLRRQN